MLRSPSVLPGCKEKEKLMRNRQVLSASISAEALIVHEEKSKPSRRPVQFAITDILPGNQKTGKKVEAAALPASLTTLGPLSLPRPGKSDALSPTNGTERNPPAAPKLKKELASPVQISSSLGNYAERLEKAENTELFAYASALCHRVTGRYLPRTLLQSDPEAQQRELERVQHDPEILRAIDSVRVLSAQFKDVAQNTMGHRRELGHTLFRIEESYLKLFEKLLELSLRLYWEYEQRTEAQRREDRAAAERWREKYERKCTECVKINKKMAAREIIHRAREIELQDYRGQMKEIENELGSQRELEAQILQLQDAAALQRVLERKLRDDFAQLTKNHEEMVEYHKQLREELQAQHKQLINDLRRTVREKDRFITKQETTLRQLEEIVAVPPVVYESRSSQTEVDDDGLWDVQDGIPRFVSKSALHKMMWRRFNAFVACKNCGGRPIPKAAKTNPFGKYPQDGSSEDVDVWSVAKGKKHTKKVAKRIDRIEQQWELPSHTVLFLSNLPKSVVAFPFYSLEKVISQIEAIYDDKFVSDRADEADGVAREELPRFICEYFLKTYGLRQSAEVGLYRFLVSVKNTYQRNSHVRLFARLSNLLKSQEEEPDDYHAELVHKPDPTSKKKTSNSSSQTTGSTHDATAKGPRRYGYLDRSFLHVFLEARHYLLRPPPRASPKGKKAHKSKAGSSDADVKAAEHVVQVEPTKKWVPLDHAINVLRWYISCFPEDSVSSYCRQVEYDTAMYDGQRIMEISGNRLAVRAEMRRVMLASEKPDSSVPSIHAPESDNGVQRPSPPRIVVDVHKVLRLLMNALEQRRDGIKRDLTALFDAGDLNHDCVLTLDEFGAIIRKRKPHFSDRRILRMFREALMGGVDQSFALSMEAFVVVCNDHGLVSLLPDDRMVDPFAVSSKLVPKNSGPEIARTTDSPVSVVPEIPEDIPGELPTARAEEVDEDGDEGGGNQRQTRENAEAVAN
ncbi:hypothetical protein PF005_g14013 [Phytophthora fragariae]|uniref:EF-hand domain-containing protein n=1 Tax=Phytophthora fragariae TaxID=53985 RepID=A0A6A3TNF0_9STRA|nr:hypothetical protein PF003_g21741 [Phytophthora fragariae]KAE8934703.1 hypothetical protein PF009_g15326 [Phytophthora fragariae]KAE9139841.1 hypothetical protein PF006_g13653 [Phytophthora fragariae]KAE9203866.1 hypothetical protein PF005_g14013 [Phytophthora fragariae]